MYTNILKTKCGFLYNSCVFDDGSVEIHARKIMQKCYLPLVLSKIVLYYFSNTIQNMIHLQRQI